MTDPINGSSKRGAKPFYTKWWFVVLAVVFALMIVGSIVGGDTDDASDTTVRAAEATSTEAAPSSSTTAPVETTTTSVTTSTTTATTTTTTSTTTTTTTTTTLPPVWDPIIIEGRGDDVVDLAIPSNDVALLTITHAGSSNFAVLAYDAAGERLELLVNEIGNYRGVRPVNLLVDEIVAFLEISADGDWTVTARHASQAEQTFAGGSASGTGDAVVIDPAPPEAAVRLEVTHNGDSNFAVIAYSAQERDLLVNEIGVYSGTVLNIAGAILYDVTANGDWTLEY